MGLPDSGAVYDGPQLSKRDRVAISIYKASAEDQQDLITRIQREFGIEASLFAADSVGTRATRSSRLKN